MSRWDKPTVEQLEFAELAKKQGIVTEIVEWEFDDNNAY